ncbi:MAG: hypothetical protein PHF11_06965 [Candidatus Omnitrophica bacterium]|nr:hypothetical protein [Candidatus Omnitrophota bacterium]
MRPSFKENADTLLNRIDTDYAVAKVCPDIARIRASLQKNDDIIGNSAWDGNSYFPLFLLPDRPMVSPWINAAVKWDSYKTPEAVVSDLKKHNIDWVIQRREGDIVFISAREYADSMVNFDRKPRKKYSTYDLPSELTEVKW